MSADDAMLAYCDNGARLGNLEILYLSQGPPSCGLAGSSGGSLLETLAQESVGYHNDVRRGECWRSQGGEDCCDADLEGHLRQLE